MQTVLPHFGPIVQNAFVVRDLDAAVAYWSGKIGVGPFYPPCPRSPYRGPAGMGRELAQAVPLCDGVGYRLARR